MLNRSLAVDCHTHIFCWGENPNEGFLSPRTQQGWITRAVLFLTRLKSEPGATMSEKIRNRLIRELTESQLDYAVVLAQDGVYNEHGEIDRERTHFFVANDTVLRLAEDCPKIIPGCSINPMRHDAIEELERIHTAGGRLIKIHTAIQGVDPSLEQFEPFYRRAVELNMVLMFHTGYEHSCTVISQKFTDPRRLVRPLDVGATVIAAHCGTCACFDRESYYPGFIEMMHRYPNLYGDTAVLASFIRPTALGRLAKEPQSIRDRILHGSDYPLPPSRLPYLHRTGVFPEERHNSLDLDLHIKQSYGFSDGYTSRILELLGMETPMSSQERVTQAGTSSITPSC